MHPMERAVPSCSGNLLVAKPQLGEPVRPKAQKAPQKFRHDSKEIMPLLSLSRQQMF